MPIFNGCWITLNRECNLRCKWCYSQTAGYEKKNNMSSQTLNQILGFCADSGVKHITLIGGEPTLYPNLEEVIKRISALNVSVGMVTNGLLLENEELIKRLKEAGLDSFSLSLKGSDREEFKQITGYDNFDTVLKAIENLSKAKVKFAISEVLTNDNIDTYCKGLEAAYASGARNFHLSFCYNFNTGTVNFDYREKNNPQKLVDGFMRNYDRLNKVTKGHFNLFQALPFCLWDESFIQTLVKRKQINSICQLLKGTGIIFDEQGYVIPCNAMHKIKIAQIGKHFTSLNELLNLYRTEEVSVLFNKLRGLPDEKCAECNKLKYCGGGCVCQYTNYSLKDILRN